MKARPSHFFDKICQHFGSETRISDKNLWANHIPISQFRSKSCCNSNRTSHVLLKFLEQTRVDPFNFFDKICQHFGSQTRISKKNRSANHNPISTCLLKILLQLQSHIKFFVKNLGANEGLTFPFFDNICQHYGSETNIFHKNHWANHTPISTISFQILLQLQSHITIFVKNPGANEGRSFPFLRQNLSAFRITNPHFQKKTLSKP